MVQLAARILLVLLVGTFLIPFQPSSNTGDWPEWRGPARDGVSHETNLPSHWSPSGENLAWKADVGGRSAPIVLGDHLYLQNAAGQGETLQERVMCFNADTGKILWEYKFNVYSSDVPTHRVGWASPAADPETGNVYVFGVGGTLLGLTENGKLIWERSLVEEFGIVTTHGGRTVSPIIDKNLVIVSGITAGWGSQSNAAHRFMAFDKRTGETVWVSTPGGRPYDTTYSQPIIANINGTDLLIVGAGDGSVHAIKPQTGEPVWRFDAAKRGINTGVVIKNETAYISHSDENLDTNEMGLLAAIDATATGKIGKDQIKWRVNGFQGGYSSPVIDGDRLYQIDNGSMLFAFDLKTGKQLWTLKLGTIQKSSPVLADGKLYVGTESGKFYILKPGPDRCEILDEDWMGSEQHPEPVLGSVAIAHERVYLVTSDHLYAIGKKGSTMSGADFSIVMKTRPGPSTYLLVTPKELTLSPGEKVHFKAQAYDKAGNLIGEQRATWLAGDLAAKINSNGDYTAPTDPFDRTDEIKATVGNLSASARVRVIAPLPIIQTFDAVSPPDSILEHWINAKGKFVVREIDGNKLLVKLADNPFTKRARIFIGSPNWSNYTVEADIKATEKRRQMGDAGIVAQRYELALFGNSQRLELQSWQPETARTVSIPFEWKADTWYHLKLMVENLANGQVRIRGKAWLTGQPEPEKWLIDKIDPIPNRQGSPGLYADAPFEIFFDNMKATPNK